MLVAESYNMMYQLLKTKMKTQELTQSCTEIPQSYTEKNIYKGRVAQRNREKHFNSV